MGIIDKELIEFKKLLDELALLKLKIKDKIIQECEEDTKNQNTKRDFDEIVRTIDSRLESAYKDNEEFSVILSKLEKFNK